MSRLTVVVGHSGMYAMSLGGERTETELREKMVSSSSLAFVAWLSTTFHVLHPVDVKEYALDEAGMNGSEGRWCFRRVLQPLTHLSHV